jgi:hypothetical protein
MSTLSLEKMKDLAERFAKRWSEIHGVSEQYAIHEKRRRNIEQRLIFFMQHSHNKKKIPNPSHVLGKIVADVRRWGFGGIFDKPTSKWLEMGDN